MNKSHYKSGILIWSLDTKYIYIENFEYYYIKN
jgi:hypothetical protein